MTSFSAQHGLKSDKPVLVMGILNVTPDSFSDGGDFVTEGAILIQAQAMVNAGADILDIGGESTRPLADKVEEKEELQRVIPAVRAIRKHFPQISISIDTTKAEVARQACNNGADIINDISACRFDPAMVKVAQEFSTPVIIMHMRGTPGDMQDNPVYTDVVEEITTFFKSRLKWLAENGIPKNQIIIDPGIGFGKTMAHNLTILNRLDDLSILGCPVLVGHSRKSFMGKILDLKPDQLDLATAAVSAVCVTRGVKILRVHDVKSTVQAIRLTGAILQAGP